MFVIRCVCGDRACSRDQVRSIARCRFTRRFAIVIPIGAAFAATRLFARQVRMRFHFKRQLRGNRRIRIEFAAQLRESLIKCDQLCTTCRQCGVDLFACSVVEPRAELRQLLSGDTRIVLRSAQLCGSALRIRLRAIDGRDHAAPS